MDKKKEESVFTRAGGNAKSADNLLFEAVDERISRAAPQFDKIFEEAGERQSRVRQTGGQPEKERAARGRGAVLRFPASAGKGRRAEDRPRPGDAQRLRSALFRWGAAAVVLVLLAAAVLLQGRLSGERPAAAALDGDTAAFVDALYGGGLFSETDASAGTDVSGGIFGSGSGALSVLAEDGEGMFGSSVYVEEVIEIMFRLEPERFGTEANGS